MASGTTLSPPERRPSKGHPHMESVTSVTCDIHVQLLVAGVGPAAVPTTLVYTAADPYAVQAIMDTQSGTVEWFFSRELLHDGLRGPAGVGDVHVAPDTDEHGRPVVSIELSTADGNAILLADAPAVAAFLADTLRVVPFGHETAHLDIDAALAFLVAGN